MLSNFGSIQDVSRVGVVAANHTGYVAAMMAIMESGDIGVPLRNANDYDRINAAGVKRVVTPEPGKAWMSKEFHVSVSNDAIALISFTSGTEGKPKGVILTHSNLANVIQRLNSVMAVDDSIREYIGVPVYHSFGFGRCRAIASAHGVFFVPEHGFDPAEIGLMLKRGEINAISAIPSLWRVLLANQDLIGNYGKRVRWIEIGSQYMSRQEKESLKLLFPEAKIVQHYGLTEASRTTLLEIHQEEGKVLESVGRALAGVSVQLTKHGRIAIQGDHVAHKYLIDGQEKNLQNQNGWFITNDLGHIEHNYLYYRGRADDIINCSGTKISPDQLEAKIYTHIGYTDGLAVCRKADPLRGDGFLIATTKALKVDSRSLEIAISKATQELGINAGKAVSIINIDCLPRTTSGKVQRKKLSEWYALQVHMGEINSGSDTSYPAHSHSYISPRTELERQLVQIWQDILNIPTIGVYDHFFELGNDSLVAVQVLAQIQKKLQVKLLLHEIFTTPTIAELALRITQLKQQQFDLRPSFHSLVPIQPHGSRPPLFGIHISYFRDLAKHLGTDQPIFVLRYGLATKTLESNTTLPARVEDLAAHYVKELRKFQPDGPYYLMGVSFGGTVALEMAQQLLAQGQSVALLSLFDTRLPSQPQLLPLQKQIANCLKIGVSGIKQRMWLWMKAWFKRLLQQFIPADPHQSPSYSYDPVQHCPIGESHFFPTYTPQPYPGKVAFFKALGTTASELSSIRYSQPSREQICRQLCGDFESYEIPGHHIELLEEPNVQESAHHLKICIDNIQTQSSSLFL
ncbi:MAG: AMP-binding protein [Leptolyngbyaceae cyanobacterium bins.349]|nr:AMP-binding protein [Leptolyngbyaceae cyanobacterium bins.349]